MSQLNQQQWQAIEQEIFGGNKIAAIKLYREASGVGLAEAKQAVEKMEADLRQKRPEQFRKTAGKSGCSALAVGLLIPAGVMLVWLISNATG